MKPLFLSVIALSCMQLAGCATQKIAYVPVSLVPLPGGQAEEYRSTLTAAAFGTVSVNGGVNRMKGEAQFLDTAISRSPNESVEARGSRSGDEGTRGCGQQFTNSYAEALASFSVQNSVLTRSYGFNLNTTVQAKGGYNKGVLGVDVPLVGNLGINVPYLGNVNICTRSSETEANATARAEGRLDFNYRAPAEGGDRLNIRLFGNAEGASVQLLNPQGRQVSLGKVGIPGILAVELKASGPYSLLARIDAGQKGQGAKSPTQPLVKTLTVSVQSQRDALALGYDEPLASSQAIALPIFVPRAEVEKEFKKALFTENGRFYPCRQAKECGDYGRDVYLFNPQLSFRAGYIVVRMDIAGTGQFWRLRPGVSGSVEVAGVPKLVKNKLYLSNVTMETQSRNAIVNFVSDRFGDAALQKLQSVASYDLSGKLAEAVAVANQKFPMRVGPACLGLKVDHVRLGQVQVTSEGIKTQAAAELSETDAKACGTS